MTDFNKCRTIFFSLFLTCGVLLISGIASAQRNLPARAIQVAGGPAKHGSGDLPGIVFGTHYIKYLSERFQLDYNFRASIHHGKDEYISNNTISGARTDASVRFTTAGLQIGVNGGLSIIRNIRHEFLISLGGFGRYQSASNGSDGYQVYLPPATGQQTILIGYDNKTPQETFSIGGIFQLQYNYTFSNNLYTGLAPGFQTDTNGDAMVQVAITLGKRF